MWLFGSDGVHVYSPDGSNHQHHVTNAQICEDPDTFSKSLTSVFRVSLAHLANPSRPLINRMKRNHAAGKSWQYCRFNDVQSDGKRFVWAAKRDGQISVLDIDTGSLVGEGFLKL